MLKKKNRAWRVLNSVIIIINIDFFPGGRGIHYYKKIKLIALDQPNYYFVYQYWASASLLSSGCGI